MKILSLILFMSPAWALAGNQVVTYEPVKVQLSGSIESQTFPGPPNFESINSGDSVERHYYLKLVHPVDVVPLKGGHPTVTNTDPEIEVKIVQLSIDANDDALWAKCKKLEKGARVTILGSLFHRWTGHHHSRTLLYVESMNSPAVNN